MRIQPFKSHVYMGELGGFEEVKTNGNSIYKNVKSEVYWHTDDSNDQCRAGEWLRIRAFPLYVWDAKLDPQHHIKATKTE